MFTTRPEIIGNFGVVASTHWLASAAGMAMLECGGNAFDAAVSAGLALQVVEPHLNGPGGEVPMIIAEGKSGRARVVCGQGVAPAAATLAKFRDLDLDLIPGDGLLATAVPGAFDAWMMLLEDYGRLSLREVMSHAIAYARDGYPLVPRICDTIAAVRELFEDEWVSSADLYLPGGGVPAPYSFFRNRELADCYGRIVSQAEAAGSGNRKKEIQAARRLWSQGFIAETIDRYCRSAEVMDSSGRRHRGLLTGQDMARWQASYEEPVHYDYEDYRVLKCGPWSQGPVFLQQLALLDRFDIAQMDPLGADFVHSVTEAAKLAFADREAFYGDPDFVEVPLETLLSDSYNEKRRRLIKRGEASDQLRPGKIEGYGGSIGLAAAGDSRGARAKEFDALAVGDPTVSGRNAKPKGKPAKSKCRGGDTCHFDIIDREGNMVSATPSGGWLHSSPIVPGLGFCLGSRMQMFWLEEGSASSLAPGKRPRTTLTPSMALRDGKPYMAFGTPGGDYQDQWQVTFFLRHVHHRMNLQEAIDAPMFHTDHMTSSFWPRTADPASLSLEERFDKKTVAELKKRGHRIKREEAWSLGRLSAATKEGEVLKAGANARGMQGYAVGR